MPQERESILVFSRLNLAGGSTSTATLIAPRLYQNEARQVKSSNLKIKIANERNEIFKKAKELITGRKRVGFEENDLTFYEYQELKKFSTGSNNNYLIPCKDLIEKMRLIKSTDEIAKIEKAQIISQKAFEELIKTIKIGQTEEEIADRLAKIIKSLGAQGLAFESIIASGPNAGIPHYLTGKKKIKKGEVLLMDFGAKFDNYHADLSRTIFIGKAKNDRVNIYNHVKEAQRAALTKIRHGVKLSEAYHFANNHFKKHKLDQYFLHGLGHGIGLEVHEAPFLRNQLPETSNQLLENMVFSVEPGLYFPWGGIRIEDLVVIKNGKAKVLGKLEEEIIEI